MFEDRRSKRVVFIAHCILNQNAKLDGCAHYPGAIREVAEVILASGCGVAQLDCPELVQLGLDRGASGDLPRTIDSEDTRIAELMEAASGRACCRGIAERMAQQAEQYVRNGFEVVGLLGVNGSPSCGVETSWSSGVETEAQGVLIREVKAACARRGLDLRIRGLKATDPVGAVEAAREVVCVAAQAHAADGRLDDKK